MAEKDTTLQKSKADDLLSFGRYLKSARFEKGISLDEIAAELRVPEKTLVLLEEEIHGDLPDPVFVKGFVRSYAQLVDINVDEAIQRYLASRHRYLQSLQFERNLIKASQTFWPRFMLILGAFAGIVLLSISALHNFNGTDKTGKGSSSADVSAEMQAAAKEVTINELSLSADQKQTAQSYLLRIKTIEATWLKVIIDRQQPKEYSLSPGDRLELKATAGFNLLIGNATGVNLQCNGRPIRIDGKKGQVVSLKIP